MCPRISSGLCLSLSLHSRIHECSVMYTCVEHTYNLLNASYLPSYPQFASLFLRVLPTFLTHNLHPTCYVHIANSLICCVRPTYLPTPTHNLPPFKCSQRERCASFCASYLPSYPQFASYLLCAHCKCADLYCCLLCASCLPSHSLLINPLPPYI